MIIIIACAVSCKDVYLYTIYVVNLLYEIYMQYVATQISALLTSVVAKIKPMRIALSCLLRKGTKFRAKRSRNTAKALRVAEGRVRKGVHEGETLG